MPSDAALIDNDRDDKPTGKVRLLTLDDLDRRTSAARAALETRDSLLSDLGGAEHVATGYRQLVQRAAVLAAIAEDHEVRWLKGETIELLDYLATVNAQRRVLTTVGLDRHARDVTPSLDRYIAGRAAQKAADAGAS